MSLCSCALSAALNAQEPEKQTEKQTGKLSEGGRASDETASEHGRAGELAELKAAVGRLEAKVDRLLQQPSEFSPVEIRVVDEEGGPMGGFEVYLTSNNAAQFAQATGVSNDDGVALSRKLPYGEYWLSVNGHGWRARKRITVEVGAPLELTVVAPSANRTGELIVEASLLRESLAGLPFGGWRIQYDDGQGTRLAPNPEGTGEESDEPIDADIDDEPSSEWQTFPTTPGEIKTVGVVVEFKVQRRIEQPDGKAATWQWQPEPPSQSKSERAVNLKWLVQSDGALRPLLMAIEKEKTIGPGAVWFQALASEEPSDGDVGIESRKESLGYHELELGEELRSPASIRLPAGRIEVSFARIYGRPSDSVLKAIDESMESAKERIWLPAVIARDSPWWKRLLGEANVENGSSTRAISQTIELSPDDKQQIAIGATK